jgi:ribonucleoside-diphosphate reductase alpha chain
MTDRWSKYAHDRMKERYAHTLHDGTKEEWAQVAARVGGTVMRAVGAPQEAVDGVVRAIAARKFMPGGRYLAATGRRVHQTQNCVLMRPGDTKEEWAQHSYKVMKASMTGAGIGAVFSDIRPKGWVLHESGGEASGPIPLAVASNELGRCSKQGGHRRAALWAGLHWDHPDVFEFVQLKQWDEHTKKMKEKDYSYSAPMDHTNISVILDDKFFYAMEHPDTEGKLRFSQGDIDLTAWAKKLFKLVIRLMLSTGEPGFSVDVGKNTGENCRNACTEIVSFDPDDICNLGSINMALVESLREMADLVEYGTMFLLAGTVYSDLPYEAVRAVREKNRRLGLGLMGLHEWLLKRGKRYGPDPELAEYMLVYAQSGAIADFWAEKWVLSYPVKTRAIAPTGTIGIVAETTTGIEPIFCAAYKRRYLRGENWYYQYVLDPTAKRLVDQGVDPDTIEDAYSISVERRLEFQAWCQQYVDHAISSTINLPAWGSEKNCEATVEYHEGLIYGALPYIRGVTTYPDGARGGQPLTPVKYSEAAKWEGVEFQEGLAKANTLASPELEPMNVCSITGGGSCGS